MNEPTTLDEAIAALRNRRANHTEADRTRTRIVDTLRHRQSQRRLWWQAAALALLGLSLSSTCYAAFFGLHAFVDAWLGRVDQAPAAVTAPRAKYGSRHAPPPSRRAEPPALVAPVAQAAPDVVTTPAEPSVSSARALPGLRKVNRKAARAPRTEITARDEAQRLYGEAHLLHFVQRDFARALVAWNSYLTLSGHQELAIEARYNRAICLVRLGQHAAAREALAPIARGEDGAYRQKEARALLRELR